MTSVNSIILSMKVTEKIKALDDIKSEIENCKICKEGKGGMAVAGEGNPDAKIVFVGEAPGRQEAASGRPFIGRSGKLLREAIREAGLLEKEVFITSVVKYLPDYKTPNDSDIRHGRIHLLKQLETIKPKVVVLLGSVAIRGVLEEKLSMADCHGTTIEKDGITYFISYHPAAAIRFKKFKEPFLTDFKLLKRYAASRS